MEKNIFDEVFINTEKETIRHYVETLAAQLEKEDFTGIETYAGYLLKSAAKLAAYEIVSEIGFAGENNK